MSERAWGTVREDVAHQRSRRIVNECDVIALERLGVKDMVQDGRLAKSIHDAAWSLFRELIPGRQHGPTDASSK
jgi:IS605 OrfB family transposase